MVFQWWNKHFWLLETFSDFNNELFRRFADTLNASRASKKSTVKTAYFIIQKLSEILFWGPQHFCTSAGTVARPYNQEKREFLTIGTRYFFGNWSLIGLFFSILALKPVDYSYCFGVLGWYFLYHDHCRFINVQWVILKHHYLSLFSTIVVAWTFNAF
jgi:hypothetical protein